MAMTTMHGERGGGKRGEEEVLLSVPVGVRFTPTDIELVGFYLRRRVAAAASPFSRFLIQEADVYATEPWNLPSDSFRYQNEENAMYFFTPRRPISLRSRRASRTAGCGFWQGNGRDNHIMDGSRLIGHSTQLTFMILKGKENEKNIKTDWIMHEFRLHSPNNTEEFDGMVLCRIYKKRSNNRYREAEEEEAKQRLAKRKRVDEHGCLMADNNEAGTCETMYSESPAQLVPLLPAPSSLSLSEMPQFASREEPECLGTPLASTNVAASAAAAAAVEQGEEEAEAARERRVKRRLLEKYPETSTQDEFLFSSSSASLPDMPPPVLWEEPEDIASLPVDDFDLSSLGRLSPLTADGFEFARLSASDVLPPLTVDDFDFDNLCYLDELFGDLPIGT